MAKTPRTRHSTSKREPVTIDLEAVRPDPQDDPLPPEEASAEASPATESNTPESDASRPVTEETVAAPEEGREKDAPANADETADRVAADTPSESVSPAPPPQPAARTSGGTLLAGLAGGVVALLLGGGLQYAGVIPSLRDNDQAAVVDEAVRQDIANLQSELAAVRAAPQPEPDQSLQAAVAEARQEIAELRENLAALSEQVSSAASEDGSEALAALEQRRAELEASFEDFSRRIGDIGEGNGDVAERLAAAETEIAGLRETVQSAGDATTARTEEVTATLQALTGRLDELEAEVARQDEGPKVALVVAATALKSAIERGSPFASELETYSSLASNAGELDQLRPYADTGIPTLAALADEAAAVATRIAAAENAPDPSAGFVDRLISSARSVVTVRPVGEVAGEGPAEIAARMESAVDRGDLGAAIAEYEALPPTFKELGADFAARLRARQAATEILDKALSSALKPA